MDKHLDSEHVKLEVTSDIEKNARSTASVGVCAKSLGLCKGFYKGSVMEFYNVGALIIRIGSRGSLYDC